jgi:hypothetical protein
MKKIFNKSAIKWILLLMWYKNEEKLYNILVDDFYDNQQKFIDYLNDTFEKNCHYFR